MGVTNWLVLLLTHPLEFRTLLQFYIYHEQKRDIKSQQEHPTSGWDRESMRRCWHFLDLTSRSFAAVIKELEGDLARTIALFYLVLRGLDTIEDDMTIPDHIKQPILRSFHVHTVTPGWSFNDCGPNEKDRQLLVEYATVVDEVNLLLPEYKAVIVDICHKMEIGMADYAHKAFATGSIYVDTIAEYDLYCHYVAGLVGEGLSRLFSASGKEAPYIAHQLELSNSMGIFLQKTNIIRDYREDTDEQRFFWPKEIWGKDIYGFKEMKDMYANDADTVQRATFVQSEMVLNAMSHATDALDYLRLLRNQSVFNFCAIPATMAIATLELCFMNKAMFQRNIKIRKADAANLIMRSTNPREVGLIFKDYARKIHAKADPSDPNFLRISVACGKIETWCEVNYPTFVRFAPSGGSEVQFDPLDVRTKVVQQDQAFDAELTKRKYAAEIKKRGGLTNGNGKPYSNPSEVSMNEMLLYVGAGFVCLLALAMAGVYGVVKYTQD
ncbi:farnesyl-diphosphate farnesyltransferase [Crepidotus variabilis]|uniref:Squalene synthase n=1 Tax=Crepidotus variabilis TaxID=179855 RepID=A0A9P6EHL2_9AGAR|nr:farnesyl-diphosphate farnesyltransferase [Crepidotus variabilis]